MHEMQTIVTDDHGVCQSVSLSIGLSVCLSVTQLNSAVHAVCVGSFGAVFAKSFWPLVLYTAQDVFFSFIHLCGQFGTWGYCLHSYATATVVVACILVLNFFYSAQHVQYVEVYKLFS